MAKKKTGSGGKNKPEKELTKAQRIEAKKAKQAQKSLKKDRKQIEEEDIEVILQEFLKKDALKTQITVEASAQPSPRANFTMSALSSGEMVMFGGEYFDGDVNVCYNDLFKWNIDAGMQEWKLISSPNSPPPRCSHQSVVYRDHLYVFGGEFATADQFHHYRDFWRLDLKTNAWEAIEEKGGPSPRSGHRMVVWRNYLVVFGGFYEAARETKWFNDLYLYSFVDMKWRKVNYPVHKLAPGARSGCQLAVHPSKDTIFVYGGYAKIKNVGEKSEGKVYSDLWALNMAPVLKKQDPTWEKLSRKGQAPSPRGGAAVTVHKQRFILFGGVFDEEKRRHTMQSTFYNDLFVYDMDRRRWFEFKLRGKKQNDGKRRRKKSKKNADGSMNDDDLLDDDDGSDDDGSDEDDEDDFEKMLENQFGYVDEDGNLVHIDFEEEEEKKEEEAATPVELEFVGDEEEEESKEEEKEEEELPFDLQISVSQKTLEQEEKKEEEEEEEEEPAAPAPCPRINPALIIRGSTLYVYGGVVEDGDREITLDDCWSLDLKRLDEWKMLLPGTMAEQEWKGEVSETEESSDGDEDSDEEDEDDDFYDRRPSKKDARAAEVDESQSSTVERAIEMLKEKEEGDNDDNDGGEEKKKKKSKKKTNDRRAIRAEMEKLQEQLNLDDINRTPQMGENLRDFFARTANYWSAEIAQRADTHERQLSIKEIKREGFAMAEVRYNELLPVLERLNVLEQEQKEAEEVHQAKKKGGKEKSRRG